MRRESLGALSCAKDLSPEPMLSGLLKTKEPVFFEGLQKDCSPCTT